MFLFLTYLLHLQLLAVLSSSSFHFLEDIRGKAHEKIWLSDKETILNFWEISFVLGLMTPSSSAMPVGVGGEGKVAYSKHFKDLCARCSILLYVSVGNEGHECYFDVCFVGRGFRMDQVVEIVVLFLE